MPELPEVEVVCRGLALHLINRTICNVRFSSLNLRLPKPVKLSKKLLQGAKIISVKRRAKFVVIGVDNGSFLVIHLGMTGRLGLFPRDQTKMKHDHGYWLLDNKMEMRFNDTRRFGSIQIAESKKQLEDFFNNIGPDPFSRSYTAKYLFTKARDRKVAVKNFIMNNRIVTGIGNIYANETLFASGIHPARFTSSLNLEEWEKVTRQSRRILRSAIKKGGTTISDYVNSSGRKGYFQISLNVYGQHGKACKNCGMRIERIVIGGRATFICNTCQK